MGILTKVRSMPDNQKKIFSLAVAIILTLIIVVVWFSFSRVSSDEQIAEEAEAKLSSVRPWQMIKDEFSKAFSGFNQGETASSTSSSTVPIEVIEN